jgi:hypothetical protein
MKRIFIIGDSFASPSMKNMKDTFFVETWSTLIKNNVKTYRTFINGQASIDTQTILDTWLKLIPNLTNEDIVIVCLPSFSRIRLPLVKEKWFLTADNTYMRFVGGNINDINNSVINYGNHITEEFIKINKILTSSDSYVENYVEIVNTLLKLTKPKSYVFTWDKLNVDFIEDKHRLTENLGVWETLDMEYNNTNGLRGIPNDFHWSTNMNEKFYNYIKEKLNLI